MQDNVKESTELVGLIMNKMYIVYKDGVYGGRIPYSRKICVYNNDENVIEVLLEMTREIEVVKT